MLIVAEIALEDYYKLRATDLSVLTNGRYIFRWHEFVRCFLASSLFSGTSWFKEYTSQISMSNKSSHVSEDSKKLREPGSDARHIQRWCQATVIIFRQILPREIPVSSECQLQTPDCIGVGCPVSRADPVSYSQRFPAEMSI